MAEAKWRTNLSNKILEFAGKFVIKGFLGR